MVNIDRRRNYIVVVVGNSLVRLIKRIPFGEKSIFNSLVTLFDVKFNDVRTDSSTYDAYSTVTFRSIRWNPFKQETTQLMEARFADSRYKTIIRLPGLPGTSALWNSPPDHPPPFLAAVAAPATCSFVTSTLPQRRSFYLVLPPSFSFVPRPLRSQILPYRDGFARESAEGN